MILALSSWEELHWKEMWNVDYKYFGVGTQEGNIIAGDNEHTQEGYLTECV